MHHQGDGRLAGEIPVAGVFNGADRSCQHVPVANRESEHTTIPSVEFDGGIGDRGGNDGTISSPE